MDQLAVHCSVVRHFTAVVTRCLQRAQPPSVTLQEKGHKKQEVSDAFSCICSMEWDEYHTFVLRQSQDCTHKLENFLSFAYLEHSLLCCNSPFITLQKDAMIEISRVIILGNYMLMHCLCEKIALWLLVWHQSSEKLFGKRPHPLSDVLQGFTFLLRHEKITKGIQPWAQTKPTI